MEINGEIKYCNRYPICGKKKKNVLCQCQVYDITGIMKSNNCGRHKIKYSLSVFEMQMLSAIGRKK